MTAVASLLAVVLGAPQTLHASAGAGGVYDTNLAHAPAGAPTEDAAGVQTWAAVGAKRPLGTRASAYAALRYDGLAYPGLSDLSRNAAGADAALGLEIGARTNVTLLPSAGLVWYGDDGRSSRTVGIGASVRTRPWKRLSLRAGYARSHRDANDSVYSSDADRIALGAEGRLARGVYLRGGWTWQWGDDVFYRPATGSGTVHGGMGRTGTFGPLLDVVRASALTRTASAGIEVALPARLHADLSFASSWVEADPGDYRADVFTAAIGWRR